MTAPLRFACKCTSIALLMGTLTLQACTVVSVAENAVDATVFVGKTAVKGTVGAGKLAVKGTKLAIRTSRAPMTCTDSRGTSYLAPKGSDGLYFCPT